MKVIIDIPGWLYEAHKNNPQNTAEEIIAEGVPLDSVLEDIQSKVDKLPTHRNDFHRTIYVCKKSVINIIDNYRKENN